MEYQELEIIRNMRAEVMSRKDVTGENLFLSWGYPTAVILFLEFLALIVWHENWCTWLWVGIPLFGAPLMAYFLKKDYEHTRRRTLDENVILMMWIFIGGISAVGSVDRFCRPLRTVLLRLSGPAHRHRLFHDGHHPEIPSQDHLWHHSLAALHRAAFSAGRPLAVAALRSLVDCCRRPDYPRTSV